MMIDLGVNCFNILLNYILLEVKALVVQILFIVAQFLLPAGRFVRSTKMSFCINLWSICIAVACILHHICIDCAINYCSSPIGLVAPSWLRRGGRICPGGSHQWCVAFSDVENGSCCCVRERSPPSGVDWRSALLGFPGRGGWGRCEV